MYGLCAAHLVAYGSTCGGRWKLVTWGVAYLKNNETIWALAGKEPINLPIILLIYWI
jgi:hypothetical protein